jgi:hypothetical protein
LQTAVADSKLAVSGFAGDGRYCRPFIDSSPEAAATDHVDLPIGTAAWDVLQIGPKAPNRSV